MKKYYLPLAALTLAIGAQAQTILSEDFETGNTGNNPQPVAAGPGWTTVNSYNGPTEKYNWSNYYSDPTSKYGSYIQGACCATVTGPLSVNPTDGGGPREEILLSPELNLDDTYQLQFSFKVSPVNCSDNSRYDFQVRVVTGDNLNGAETIFSIQNEKMLRESGIIGFPIQDWAVRTAKVDLSDFKGEKVKLAFVYKMMAESANSLDLDDITVKKFTPATGPVASITMDRFTFPAMYIGEKMYSDPITLVNMGKDGLRITGIDCPEGVTTTLDQSINLQSYQSTMFNVAYTASLTSPASGKVTIHTTGGDVSIDINASKQFLPEGAYLETFEGFFPPAGWTNRGWAANPNAFEGDQCAYQGGDFSLTTFTTPRLDLLDGGSISFTYYNAYDGETAPEYDVTLKLSTDGGQTFNKLLWTSDWQNGLNQLLTETITLDPATDNCYLRWEYPAVESDDEGAYEHSAFYLDRVVLPKVYGADGVPMAATNPTPAAGTANVYPKGIVLSWNPAQFAEGYKLYLGTTSACNEVIDGQDLGDALSIALPNLEYETRYTWKVVPYNSKGDANNNVTTWTFTTQKDAAIVDFPYEQNFTDTDDELPIGWTSTPSKSYDRTWYVNSLKKYENDGKSYGVAGTIWLNAGESNAMLSPDVTLPADKPMSISFIWGDEHPASLVVDPTGMVQKNNVEPNNGVSELLFEIYADGEWTTLSTISEKSYDGEHKYWINERHDLTTYAGKKVQFRWVHKSYNGQDEGGSVTHIVIDEAKGDYAAFNRARWTTGKINYEKSISSGDLLTVFNLGKNDLTVKSATFANPNFTTSLKAGDVLPAGSTTPFTIQFDALQTAGQVSDNLTLEFEGGHIATFPVEGEALPANTRYFSFEPNDLDLDWTEEFTMIDADKAPNYSFTSYWIHYSADGVRGAFSVESDSEENGLYGMMAPISGMHALVGSSGTAVNADNWIISRKLIAGENAKFDFYARNWESLNSVLPDPKHCVSVLVSTGGNTDTNEFTAVMRTTEMPFLEGYQWNHYEVDLKDYAGQSVYVALRHSTFSPSNLAFFDDFTLTDFHVDASGIENVSAEDNGTIAENARVEVYNINGVLVAAGYGPATLDKLAKGFYVVKAEGSKAFSIIK